VNHNHYFLKGLQASGKSTFAKDLLDKYPNVYVRVNKDDLRKTLYNDNFSKPNEKLINYIEESIIKDAVKNGKKIIWDNTHLESKHEDRMRELEKNLDIKFVVKEFKVTLEEAIKRNIARGLPISNEVIEKTYKRYFSDNRVYNQPRSSGKRRAFIVDLDGTLAFNTTNRGWYDWDAVDRDTINKSLLHILRSLKHEVILFVSGRDGVAREKTEKWLMDNGFPMKFNPEDYKLFMRAVNDNRSDDIVKEEIYDNLIDREFDVIGVFDDRLSVCKMWHKKGLPLYRFGDPTANF
jgi:predicted kinase